MEYDIDFEQSIFLSALFPFLFFLWVCRIFMWVKYVSMKNDGCSKNLQDAMI